MARSGVNYIDISKAAKAIQENNEEPTVDRVRALLGTGSKSTIGPLLKRWKEATQREEEVTNSNDEVADLPDEIMRAASQLSARVNALADERIAEADDEIAEIKEECAQKVAAAQTQIHTLTQQNSVQKMELSNNAAVITALNSEQVVSNLTNAKLSSTVEQQTKEIANLKIEIDELKQEKRDVREHFEHFQAQTALDRDQEREQFRNQIHNLNNQLDEAKHINAALTAESHTLNEKNTSLLNDLKSLQLENQQLTHTLSAKTEALAQAHKAVRQTKDEALQTQHDLDLTKTEYANIKHQLAQLESRVANEHHKNNALEKDKEKLEERMTTLNHRIDILTDKNIEIAQEKALFEGQLQQLQRSL